MVVEMEGLVDGERVGVDNDGNVVGLDVGGVDGIDVGRTLGDDVEGDCEGLEDVGLSVGVFVTQYLSASSDSSRQSGSPSHRKSLSTHSPSSQRKPVHVGAAVGVAVAGTGAVVGALVGGTVGVSDGLVVVGRVVGPAEGTRVGAMVGRLLGA